MPMTFDRRFLSELIKQGFERRLRWHLKGFHRRFTRSASIGGSRGAPPSGVHEERLHQRFTRSSSIGGLRGAPPSEVSANENDYGHISVIPFQTFDQRTGEARMRFLLSLLLRHLIVVIMLNLPGLKILPQRMPLLVEVSNESLRDYSRLELLHLAPSPYYMPYPYDEGLSSNPPNMKGEWGEVYAVKLGILKKDLFKYLKVCKAIIDRVPIPTQLLRAEGLTANELSNPRCQQLTNDLKEQTLIIVRVNEQEAQLSAQLDLQEIELEDLKHQPSIEQSETHKLKNAIIEREKDLFENSSKRTSRDLFKNSSRVASSPKHLLVSSPWQLVPTLNERDAYSPVITLCLHLLLLKITPSLRGRYCTTAPEEVKR
ncbi:hypothetical protein Tco_0978339 [Tanacetum coccineum]|uniref:Uncharacterized protein n=1 Tax=Tanacetum coccineum TaxID=301880 RepID=A0ABQ5ENS0_9ASTR